MKRYGNLYEKICDFQEILVRNETFAFEIERFYGHFVNELKLTNKSKYTIISYNTTIKSFIAFIREYEKPISFENLK